MALRAHVRGAVCVVAVAAAALVIGIGALQPTQKVVVIQLPPWQRTGLGEGDPAPDFSLTTADGARTVELSDLTGEKPVVLIFGSYSCPPFRQQAAALRALYKKYRQRVEFCLIYVIEAHPIPGQQGKVIFDQGDDGAGIAQATNETERAQAARHLCSRLQLNMPTLIDNMQNTTSLAYGAMPGRFYLLDCEGRVAYQGRHGHESLSAAELENAIQGELVEIEQEQTCAAAGTLRVPSGKKLWSWGTFMNVPVAGGARL